MNAFKKVHKLYSCSSWEDVLNIFLQISVLNFEPLFHSFSKFIIYTTRGCLQSNLRNSSVVDFEKKFLKHFSYIFRSWTLNPLLTLAPVWGPRFHNLESIIVRISALKKSQCSIGALEILRRSVHSFVYIFYAEL